MNSQNNTDTQVIRAIKRGAFKRSYLIYVRKSTDEANNQKNSISYQKTENGRFAERLGLPIAHVSLPGFCTHGIIAERHSGFKEGDELTITSQGVVQYRIDRPKFQQLVQFLSHGHFRGVVVLSWDRLSRNRGDDTVIRKLMRRGVDVRFAYAQYDNSSAGELHMDIDGMFAQHHSRITSEKVRLATRANRLAGKCTYRAPIGYLNTGRMDYKPLDPERAPFIKELFERYATGDWSLADLARLAMDQGIETIPVRRPRSKRELLADDADITDNPKVSRPLTENHISRILSNPFYTGRLRGVDGGLVRSTSHQPLVSDRLFDDVQMKLGKRTVSRHYTNKLDLPFRGLVRCGNCGRAYVPYRKKGHLYFRVRCAVGCSNTLKNCSLTYVADELSRVIANLVFTDEELAKIEACCATDVVQLQEEQHQQRDRRERQAKRLRSDLNYLQANRLALLRSGAYTPEALADEAERLNREIRQLGERELVSDAAMQETMADVVTITELLKTLSSGYKLANPSEQDEIARIIITELLVTQNSVEGSPQTAFKPFMNKQSAVCEPTAWLAELRLVRQELRMAMRLLNVLTK